MLLRFGNVNKVELQLSGDPKIAMDATRFSFIVATKSSQSDNEHDCHTVSRLVEDYYSQDALSSQGKRREAKPYQLP